MTTSMIDVQMFRDAVDPSSLHVAKPVAAELKRIVKVKSFNSDRGGAALIRASALIAVFAGPERSRTLAEALRLPDQNLSHLQRGCQREAYATGVYASSRGVTPPPVADRTHGWVVKQPLMDGFGLRHHIDRSPEERQMDEFMPVSGHLDLYASDVTILSTMWLFGGSEEWPLPRIEDEWSRNAAAIRELPGYLDD